MYSNCSRTSYWAPAAQPVIYHPARLELIDQKLTGINTRNLTFSLTGEAFEYEIDVRASRVFHRVFSTSLEQDRIT